MSKELKRCLAKREKLQKQLSILDTHIRPLAIAHNQAKGLFGMPRLETLRQELQA